MDDRPATRAAGEPRAHDGRGPKAPPILLGLQIAAVVVLVGWALHATASVSALIAAALFIAVVTAPLDRRVGERMPEGLRWLGHVAVLLLLLLVLAVFGLGLFFAAQRVAGAFPGVDAAAAALPDLVGPESGGADVEAGSGDADGRAADAVGDGDGRAQDALAGVDAAGTELLSQLSGLVSGAAFGALQWGAAALSGVVLAIFLALILLVDAPGWRRRAARALGPERADGAAHVLGVVGRQVRRFLMVRTALGLATAVLYMLWLWLFGVDLVLVWGVLTVLLSFIPNLGSILSGVLPTIYAFLTKDLGTALAVGAGLTVIEQVIGNFLDPRLQGRYVSVSPTVILAGLLVWTWIWGVPGALLSTPVLIMAIVACAHVAALRPVSLLLSDCDGYDELDRITGRA